MREIRAEGRETHENVAPKPAPKPKPQPVRAPAIVPDPVNIPEKPPFTKTPLGQPLSFPAPATDSINTTPTPNSPQGGFAGNTRSGGTKKHGGVDDPSKDVVNQDVVRYHGASEGVVTQAGPAYTSDGTYLGERVTIQVVTDAGVWESKTMHHEKVTVSKGDKVSPGDKIAEGSGKGEQFDSPQAGAPHVHWEVRLNGKKVDPVSGKPLE